MKKVNGITQYRPAYFSGFEEAYHQFDTLEELKEIAFVKDFMRDDVDPFLTFALSHPNYPDAKYMIFAVYQNPDTKKSTWWGVGYLDAAINGLPNLEDIMDAEYERRRKAEENS